MPTNKLHIESINNEIELKRDALKHFKEYKSMKQYMFYFASGMEKYYEYQNPHKTPHSFLNSEHDYYKIFSKNIPTKKAGKIAFISLGVGNCRREKIILNDMYKAGYDFDFFAVDSSMMAMEMTRDTLQDVPYHTRLLCADFTSDNFKSTIKQMITGYDTYIYTFLGGTFGNNEQDYLADILYNMLDKGDYLWLDGIIRTDMSETGNRALFDRYTKYLHHENIRPFIINPIINLGIDEANGNIGMRMSYEPSLNALRFNFSFTITQKIAIVDQGETMLLIPNTILKLLIIRAYDHDMMKKFFEARHFTYIDYQVDGILGQFFFQRK